ncbi:hypothetical protein [Chitinophaga parva]|uniref:hypothetical protein n=1 Tax=Chitinophaga parva TaxID=2169414 RepID=UPI001056FD1D|nr:hypothetical protein [Chitinophaga parva]
MDYDIVNVSQAIKVAIDPKTGKINVLPFTDIFPSATLDVNRERIINYPQPSSENTHHLTPKDKRVNGYRPTIW